MLLALRLLSLLVGGFTAWRVLGGQMTSTLFKVPDLAVGAVMVLAALIPNRGAAPALVAANAYAFGVFSVALAGYLVPSKPVEPLLIAGMAVNLVVILLLLPRMTGGGHQGKNYLYHQVFRLGTRGNPGGARAVEIGYCRTRATGPGGVGATLFWQRFSKMQARGIAAALVASLIGAGFSAQALAPASKPKAEPRPVATGYEAEDHFPGAALYYAVDEDAAVGAGTTGTARLPDMPIPADATDGPVDGSIQPALPFHLAGSGVDRARALQCLTTAIYYEAANEPADGQRAVAQVILNRVRHPAFPATVCGVVFQGSEKRGCQFSFACDGAMDRAPSRAAWDRAARVAAAALAGQVFAPVGMATHYHTYAVTPVWNRGLVMTGVFGAHFFHRWKGWWGTAAAFRQAYRGGEPLPEPHVRTDLAALIAPVVPMPVPMPAVAGKTAAPAATPRETIQPAYAQSGTPIGGYAPRPQPAATPADDGESQILDKWKDSGKPLR